MSVLEQDVVIGCFTHRDTYIKTLEESLHKFLPEIPYIRVLNDAPINVNMELLRQKFIESGKRFWVFLDDDIQFLNSDIVKNALETLVSGKYAGVSVYNTPTPAYLSAPYNPNDGRLKRERLSWMTGYFMMVDSWRVGHIMPDFTSPAPNTSVDVDYSLEIRKAGFDMAISHDYVYHLVKNVPHDYSAWEAIHGHMESRYGSFYFDMIKMTKCIIL